MTDCIICGFEEADEKQSTTDTRRMNCPRCGEYIASGSLSITLLQATDEKKKYLSAWALNEYTKTSKPPIFNTAIAESIWSNMRHRSVAERQDALLLATSWQSAHPGAEVLLNSHIDFGYAWADNPSEMDFHLQALVDSGYLRPPITMASPAYLITTRGWQRVDEISRPIGLDSNNAFVAMSFSENFTALWTDGIKLGIKDAGFDPIRVDQVEENIGKIDDFIMASIRGSRFIVVDVTSQNPGAYFEAGFALGLDRKVIWTVDQADMDAKKLHFDTRQFAHIVWKDPADLREKLKNKILAVIGPGANYHLGD